MDIKPTFFKAILTSLILISPMSVVASDIKFKVAVIKDALGSQEILLGNFDSGINKLTQNDKVKNAYDNNMGLCVAYLQTNNATKSESACTAAINSAKAINAPEKKVHYLQSLSYNNRGISRYKSNDLAGAINDLVAATSIDSNAITASNLKLIKELTVKSPTEDATKFSE